jgi:hypothetical protein
MSLEFIKSKGITVIFRRRAGTRSKGLEVCKPGRFRKSDTTGLKSKGLGGEVFVGSWRTHRAFGMSKTVENFHITTLSIGPEQILQTCLVTPERPGALESTFLEK